MPSPICREQLAHFSEAESLNFLPALTNFVGSPTNPKPSPRELRLRGPMEALRQERLDEAAATEALSGLVPAWEVMTPDEQGRVVRLLVSQVAYDGQQGKASITFQPLGLKTLASEMLGRNGEEYSACVGR